MLLRTLPCVCQGDRPRSRRGSPPVPGSHNRALDVLLNDDTADWLSLFTDSASLLLRFLRFRMDSITGLVAEAHALASGLNRRVGFDLFSPRLAPLVGQDYRALARFADWIKPMTYRVAEGPAGLRLEIPALAEGVSQMMHRRRVREIGRLIDLMVG